MKLWKGADVLRKEAVVLMNFMQKVTGVKKPRKGSYPPDQWTALVEQINRTLRKWSKEHGAKNVFRYQNGQVSCRIPRVLTLTCKDAARPYFSAGFG